ncbi:MAG: GHKL domain-containing protein [Cenarchaeum sp. SB0661_bin_35]|nr:GHKL domain-containing protein [Cenarchaeum sp. SB0666_bin_15]MYC79494.1 GHKL domain-containing protein [Cenarchaeum sp. SB0661_bin_35]
MMPLHSVVLLVGIQIMLISASFSILIYAEAQNALNGNLINIVGKNRLLANTIQLELNRALFHDYDVHQHIDIAITNMENNIHIVKNGGIIDDVEIPPLPPEFDSDYDILYMKFMLYKSMVYELLESRDLDFDSVEGADVVNKALIDASDSLTEKLGHNSETIAVQNMFLQILLGSTNIVILIIMVIFMWRIIKKYTAQTIRTEKFEVIGKFASMMAHDIRNPLGSLRNSIEIIQRSNPSLSTDNEMVRINRSIKRISHQVEGVLNYVRAVPLIVNKESITSILHRSAYMMTIPENITITLPDEDDSTIECDAEKLEFVFVNLLLNAVQAIGDDTGRINVKISDKNNYEPDNYITITIENSGPTIPDEVIPHVFEPMFTTKMQGTGLGLTSSKNIIELHNGTISVSNADGMVLFIVRIPKVYNKKRGGTYRKGKV